MSKRRKDWTRLGFSPLGRKSRVWVTVYAVTRHCGGGEEGGWWYNWYEPVTSQYALVPHAHARRAKLRDQYAKHAWGDIYSMGGGEEFHVIIEPTLHEYATTVRPHYE